MITEQDLLSITDLVRNLTNRYSVKGMSNEDLYQECLTKLWHERYKYDKSKGKLTTFTYTLLENHILSLIRRENNTLRSNHVIVDNQDIILSDVKNIELDSLLEQTQYSIHELDTLFTLYNIGLVNDTYAPILRGLLRNETFRKIGKDLGISKQRVHQIYNELIDRVRGEIR